MNGAGAGLVTKIPHLVHLRGHALQQCSMAVFNPQFQRTRYQGRHGSNSSSCNMNIQDALDLHLKEEAFRIIGNHPYGEQNAPPACRWGFQRAIRN